MDLAPLLVLLSSVAYVPDPVHDATHEEGVVYVHTVVDHGDGPVTTCEKSWDDPMEENTPEPLEKILISEAR